MTTFASVSAALARAGVEFVAVGGLLPLSVAYGVEGVPVRFLGAEGLIRPKADSLRPRDRLDVAALRVLPRRTNP